MLCDLAAIQTTYRVGEADALAVLRSAHRAMIGELLRRFAAGKITARNLNTQRRSKYKHADKVVARLRAVYESIGSQGRSHVDAELGKQRRNG